MNSETSQSPASDPSNIDMHESRIRVVTDPAAPELKRRLADPIERRAFYGDVDRHTLHVEAASRHTRTGVGQRGIGLR